MRFGRNICCVGGLLSCIGAWGVGSTSCPASYYLGIIILPLYTRDCKGIFALQLIQSEISDYEGHWPGLLAFFPKEGPCRSSERWGLPFSLRSLPGRKNFFASDQIRRASNNIVFGTSV